VTEALSALELATPDVLVGDIEMPGDDGYSLIQRVRAFETLVGVRIPAAALTAHVRPEDRTRALEVGYDLHIAKPADPIDLIAAIASLVQHSSKSAPAGH
jgi:CheY-like chemotaxis protein